MTGMSVERLDRERAATALLRRAVPEAAAAPMPAVDVQVWYELEYSRTGAEDWFAASGTTDTEEAAQRMLAASKAARTEGFEYRAVRKTLLTEVLA